VNPHSASEGCLDVEVAFPRRLPGVPVVTVTALGADREVVERLLLRLAEGVAGGVSCPVGDVWCSYVPASAQYIGARVATSRAQCPIVVIRGRVRDAERVAAGMAAAARVVAAELKVPFEDVWVQWLDVLPGKAFAGGDMIG
jgi:hypothetical protein